MAQIKVVKVEGRLVTLDVLWEDGLKKNGLLVPDVPVESFSATQAYLFSFVSGVYSSVKAEAAAFAYANPVIDPQILAAVGHTFDDAGNVIS